MDRNNEKIDDFFKRLMIGEDDLEDILVYTEEEPFVPWKNGKGTSRFGNCKCGPWWKHWINFSGEKWPKKCAVEDCDNDATQGGHILRSGKEYPNSLYIAPMCEEHNNPNNEDEFYLKDGYVLVSANRQRTCEK